MEQRSCGNQLKLSFLSEFSRDETEVAGILLELPRLFGESERRSKFPFSWGSKKRRSAEEGSVMRRLILLPPSPSSSSPSPSPPVVGPVPEPEKGSVRIEASSPATPLSFSPSESDETPKRLKTKASVKKSKEGLLRMIEQCSRSNEFLINEIQRVRNHYQQLQAANLSLKAQKQELSFGIKRGVPALESTKSLNLDMKPMLGSSRTASQQPLITDRTVTNEYHHPHQNCRTLSLFPSGNGLGLINDKEGPLGLPDLNASPPEAFWMDGLDSKSLRKALAARARRERMKICRQKSSNISKRRMSSR